MATKADARVEATPRSRTREYISLAEVNQLRADGWPFPVDVQRDLLAECPSARDVIAMVDRRAALVDLIVQEETLTRQGEQQSAALVDQLSGGDNSAIFDQMDAAEAHALRHRSRADALRKATEQLPEKWSSRFLATKVRGEQLDDEALLADLDRIANAHLNPHAVVVVLKIRHGRRWDLGSNRSDGGLPDLWDWVPGDRLRLASWLSPVIASGAISNLSALDSAQLQADMRRADVGQRLNMLRVSSDHKKLIHPQLLDEVEDHFGARVAAW